MKNDPREIAVRYPAVCAETGKPLPKGSVAVYYPRSRKLYHPDSRTAADFRSQRFADAAGLADANW